MNNEHENRSEKARSAVQDLNASSQGSVSKTVLPDRGYFTKVIKRQWWFGSLIFGIVVFVSIPVAFTTKNVYTSKVITTFDDKSKINLSPQERRSDSIFGNIEASFQMYFSNPEFIYEVAEAAQVDKMKGEGILSSIFNLLRSKDSSDAAKKAATIEWLKKKLTLSVQPGTNIFGLTTSLETPEDAQNLAAQAMEMFIQKELQTALQKIDVKLDFLKQSLLSGRAAAEGAKGAELSGEDAKEKSLTLRQKEAELLDKIKALESDMSDINKQRVQRRVFLETEFDRLQSKLQPNHPDLIAKKQELDSLKDSLRHDEKMVLELKDLRHQLWQIRTQMLYLGLGQDATGTTGVSLEEKLETDRIMSLTQRIEELELEKGNIERQIREPELRGILRVTTPATFDPKPAVNKKQRVLFGSVALGFALALFLILWRELRTPLARDDWRVFLKTGKPVLAQISKTSLQAFDRITPDIAGKMREQLGSAKGKDQIATKTLLAYRRLELVLRQDGFNRSLLFLNSGPRDQTSSYFYSFANVAATDIEGGILVVDLNRIDPLIKGVISRDHDICDVLQGKTSWKEVVVKKVDMRAFDLIPPPKDLVGERGQSFKVQTLKNLFSECANNYKLVLVRGMPESYFIENAVLADAVEDVILFVDGLNTTYHEMNRSLIHLGSDKIKGLVLIGT